MSDFDTLVQDILENPELLLKTDLSTEQLLEIQKRINPYAGVAGSAVLNEDKKRIAVVSYTNLREDYIRRFAATSLIGFVFQMFKEWEVPAEQRRWNPRAEKVKPFEPFTPDQLVECLESALHFAKESQSAAVVSAAAKQDALDADVLQVGDSDKNPEVLKKYELSAALESKAVGMLYVATHVAHRIGTDASNRLSAMAEIGMKYPEVKAIISKYKLPNAPGQLEMPPAEAKNVIGAFIKNLFEFDPNVHVRSANDGKGIVIDQVQVNGTNVDVDLKDPEHLTLSAVRALAPKPTSEHADAFKTITSTQKSYNAVVSLLRDEDLADAAMLAISSRDAFKHYLLPVNSVSPARPAADIIPSQDTFHRWSYYTEVNYEELRTITEALYPERPDLDWAIGLWDVFEGPAAEVDDKFEKYCQRYAEEVPSAIKSLEFGSWSLLADFKENRKKVQFYNKNTDVLKRIIDRHTEDKRIGADLMRNRVRQVKAKNIAENGPDAEGLVQYKQNTAEKSQDLAGKGVEKVISLEEMRRLEKAQGNIKAAKELELLEQYEKTIKDLSELELLRPLTNEEQRSLTFARDTIGSIHEMIAVPEDTVQVDIFTNNTQTGEFVKSHFYTKADEAAAERPKEITQLKFEHPAVAGSIQHANSRENNIQK